MKKKKVEVEEYESSLDKEEKILEGICDSLKGKVLSVSSSRNHAATEICVCM
jgi:structural maintenance of chromosome 4